MPKLSIVIPVKNEETDLPKLLASIKAQTFTDYEVIVADAHSTDKTVELAQAAGAIVVEGGMPGSGRNRGAEAASTGDPLAEMDIDDSAAADGVIVVSIPVGLVRGLVGYWDLQEVIGSGAPTTLFAGPVTWSSDVTR